MNLTEKEKQQRKSRMSKGEIIGLILLTGMLTICFYDWINIVVDAMLPTVTVTIKRADHDEGRRATILYEEYEHNPDELFLQLKMENEEGNHAWKYTQGVLGESWTMLVGDADSEAITICVKESPRKYLSFLCNRGGGVFEISLDDEKRIIDTYRDQDQSDVLRIYPFERSTKITVIRLFLYVFLFGFFLILFLTFHYLFVNRLTIPGWLLKPISMIDSLFCFVILAGTGILLYKFIGIPNYLEAGDEVAYWKTTIGIRDLIELEYLSGLFPLRGYLCYVPQSILQYFGSLFSLDAAILWILFLGILWTILICGIFPGIYKILHGAPAKRLHALPMALLLLTTQRHYLTSVMFDGIGMIAFFAFVYFMLCVPKSDNWRMAGSVAGICASIACNLRMSYLAGVVGIAIYVIFTAFREKPDYKKIVEGVALGLIAFLIVCVPQFAVNYARGHVGIFPYDGEYLAEPDPDQPWLGRTVAVWSSDYGMAHGNVAYPLLATDPQMLTMKKRHYGISDPALKMEQLLDIYSDSPMETLMLIAKKMVIGFDQKTNVNSPGDGAVPWRETEGMLFSLWNYFVLFSGCFAFVKSKTVTKSEKRIAHIVLLFLVLPETFLKMEWRYVLPGYFMIYYFFTYAFVVPLLENKEFRKELLTKTRYLTELAIFAFCYFTLSFILLAQYN